VLNELCDMISDAALTLPFAAFPGWNPVWMAAAVFAAALVETAGAIGPIAGGGRRYDGPFGKSDRALALGAMGAWLALGWPVGAWFRAWAPPVWLALCGLTILN